MVYADVYFGDENKNKRKLFKLLEKRFPEESSLYKSMNNAKLGYSCMTEFEMLVKKKNNEILLLESKTEGNLCNCRKSDFCPLSCKCLVHKVVYMAMVKSERL